jgi:type IV pilus assembly protein PilN
MIRINLLPVRVSKKKQAATQQLAIAIAVVLLALAGNFWWSQARANALDARQAKLRRTKAEIAQLEKIIGEVNDIKQQQAAVKEKLAVLEKLKAGRTGPVRLLDGLASVTPKRLWLKSMDESGGAVAFTGSAASIDDVSAFMAALERSEFFSKVELERTTARSEPGKAKVVDFSIRAAANYTPEVVAAAAPGATTAQVR